MVEDTRAAEAQENEAVIAEMMRDAKVTDIPSEATKDPLLHKGDEEQPAPMTVRQISSAGYVYIFNTQTGDRVPVLYYMLPSRLRRRRPDGSFIFTTNDPKIEPLKGLLKCYLHEDSPSRAEYTVLGFRTCRKSNITNEYQRRQHMKLKHKAEWATIEDSRKERERQEDRELQQLFIKSQLPKEEPAPEPEVAPEKFLCPTCGKEYMYKGKQFRKHVKECK